MTNRGYGVVAAILCAAGTLSAGALAYELRAPAIVPYSQSFVTARELIQTASARSLTTTPTEMPSVVELPPTVIVAGPHAATASAGKMHAAAPRDIGDMHCTDWRSLEQGPAAGLVRLCE
jgi:hypothetical protein